MARKEVEVEVNYKPKGLDGLKRGWSDFAGDLLEPVVLLAAGATKAQAAWAGFRGVFEARVLGPLGLVAGASIAFLATTRLLVGQWKALGMAAAGSLERMTLQFRPLLGSLASAKERVRELSKFAIATPFELPEIVEANKMLEVLTQGALATEKGMTLVGDAAAVAGTAFSDTARMVGRLYDGLMSGRPVGEAAMRLQEMGIISGTVRNQLESMQAAGASGTEIWKVMERQLERNKGAMAEQSRSLEGLQSTWADTKRQMEGGFSAGFLEGEKAGVESSTKLMEAMSPVMANLGRELGRIENAWAKFKLGVVDAVTSFPGFSGAVELAIRSVEGLAAVLGTAAVASIGGFGVYLLKLVAGNKAAAQSAGFLTAMEGAAIPAGEKLSKVRHLLGKALDANAAGAKGAALENVKLAMAQMKNLATSNGLVAVVSIGNKLWMAMGLALRFVAIQAKAMALAIITNPLVLTLSLLALAGMAWSKYAAVQDVARERVEGYTKATAGLDNAMQKQISDIRTLVDLRAAESKILTELTGAYRALDEAKTTGDKAAAEDRVVMLKGKLKGLPKTGGLERDEAELAREQAQREGLLRLKDYERDAMAAKGPEEALRVAEERQAETRRRRSEALALGGEEGRIAASADEARKGGTDTAARRQSLLARKQALEDKIAKFDKADRNTPDFGLNQVLAQSSRDALSDVELRLAEMPANTGDSGRLQELLGSPSELQQVKAKIEVIASLRAAIAGLGEAEAALAQNADEGKSGGLKAALEAAKEGRDAAEQLAAQAGVSDAPRNSRLAQDLETRKNELEARRVEDMDPLADPQRTKEREAAERTLATARLDAEAAVAALRLRGQEREEKLLDIERQKLEIQIKGNAIGQGAALRARAELDARDAALAREGRERRDELSGALAVAKLRRAEGEARLEGDTKRAEQLRKAAEAQEDARARVDAMRDAEGVTGTAAERGNYVEARMQETRDARESERKRNEGELQAGRGRSRANAGSSVAAIEAEKARLDGHGEKARMIEEAAARKQDELDRVEAEKRLRGQGFDKDTAKNMASAEIKTAQARRMMEGFGGSGTIIASSLAKIGGGGNVTGTDKNLDELKKVNKALAEIADNTKDVISLKLLE
jgi:hypothetical protein